MKKRIFAVLAAMTLIFGAGIAVNAGNNSGGPIGTFELPSMH
ncbi:hypothetical protein [Bacillus infantis]|jgi:hypothetical protein|nr:hypothetical protein [Bacillus infantis]